MVFDNRGVVIHLVERPGADDTGITPPGDPSTPIAGSHIGVGTIVKLTVIQRIEPTGKEGSDIHIVRTGADKYLGVPGPAHPLIPLGTVGRHLQVIAPLPPDDIMVQLVEHGVGTFKETGNGAIRGQNHTGQDTQIRLFGKPGNLDILKSMKGKTRLPDFFTGPFQGIAIRASGGPQIFGIDGTIRIQHLGEPQNHLCSGLPFHLQSHPTDHVLAHIENILGGFRLAHSNRFNLHNFSHGNTGVAGHYGIIRRDCYFRTVPGLDNFQFRPAGGTADLESLIFGNLGGFRFLPQPVLDLQTFHHAKCRIAKISVGGRNRQGIILNRIFEFFRNINPGEFLYFIAYRRFPGRIVIANRIPAGQFPAGIVIFPIEHIRGPDRPLIRYLPRIIRPNELTGSIGEFHLQLDHQSFFPSAGMTQPVPAFA
ncbi:MAG: hypothetical protein BWY71_02098 [Planctomycetes bacterium ADurb.Bin412]|nr:MAG: hypothetical protein BWY71_02098 [Planctomycetes bacterium ADurb.Bin412]